MPLTPFSEIEYRALRKTIASRGTVRMALVPATLFGWAALVTAVLLLSPIPLAALPPLLLLAGGFESVHALHVGVERIGRYVQVFYEETLAAQSEGAPKWEVRAMTGGPKGGITLDPLFSALFAVATLVNLTIALVARPTTLETVVIAFPHLALIARILQTRSAASRQRARDLDHYRAVRDDRKSTT